MQYENMDTLENEIQEFITEQSELMMERWSESGGTTDTGLYSTYVHWSVAALNVVLALFAITCQINKRKLPDFTKEKIKTYTSGIFFYKVNLNLDKIIHEKNFKNSAFIDKCFEDNVIAQNRAPEIEDMVNFITDKFGKEDLPFAISVLKFAPARWFECDYGQLDGLVNFCLCNAINSAKLHKNSKILSLGPKEIIAAHMVKILSSKLLGKGSWVNMMILDEHSEAGNGVSQLRNILLMLNQSNIDYMLIDKDDVF
jgi:hypothetical protein